MKERDTTQQPSPKALWYTFCKTFLREIHYVFGSFTRLEFSNQINRMEWNSNEKNIESEGFRKEWEK